jgi:lipoprotein NlpI
MPFELVYFHKVEEVLRKKDLVKDVQATMEYLDEVLYGSVHKGELMRQALEEMGWRDEKVSILNGRRYQYKGFKKGIAIEGNLSAYEAILEGLIRLQIGYDKKKIEAGILVLTSQRSAKTPYGSTRKMLEEDMESLYPTISLPVLIALFDLGRPLVPEETENGNRIIKNHKMPKREE